MNNDDVLLTSLNHNASYDLKTSAQFLYENDDWPNPYLHVNIDSKFFDTDSFYSKFSNHPHPVFLSINIQSLMSKYDNLKIFVSDLIKHNVPIASIAVQEVWSVQHSDLVYIPGFKFYYNSRGVGRGGGG
jgi:hypothetical protein